MTPADIIHMLDLKYSKGSPDAVLCPNEGQKAMLPQSKQVRDEHGYMTVHSSGQYIVCGICDAKQPIARI